jgi:hypothetical protein
MSSSVNKTTPLLIYQPLPLAQAALLSMASQQPSPLTSPALETDQPLESPSDSPLITKPPVPVAMADKLMASVLWAMSQNTPLITLAIKMTTPLPAL